MGTVNIFLGGTGKHIAEDIQDSLDFYGLNISEPVAFDLDASTRAGVNLRGFVPASQGTIRDVDAIAGKWAAHDPGAQVAPAQDSAKPGPQLRPEHSVLVPIGQGIAANPDPTAGLYALRGHGLTVFSALFDPAFAIAGAGEGNRLRGLIAARIGQERGADGEVRINLVTSTAGGTGAGTVIPLALWLRAEYPNILLNLIAITPTAFESVLRGNPNSEELKAKGRSGTYAMFRELSFFQEADPQTGFSDRSLPVTAAGLTYSPGQKLFDRVYWFGGRAGNDSRDAFEEAGALLRILSSDNTARELQGKTGAHPLKSVGSVTAIEYPRLRLQRKLVSRVLVAAYKRLREKRSIPAGGTDAADSISLLDYVRNASGRKLGDWFLEQRNGALALAPGTAPIPLRDADADTLARHVGDEAQIQDYSPIHRGAQIRGGNYDADARGWRAYVNEVTGNLRAHAAGNQKRIEGAIPKLRAEEEDAFADWLRALVFGQWLSGEGNAGQPDGIGDVQQRLTILRENARELEGRTEDEKFIPGTTLPEIDDRIKTLTEKLDKPDARPVKPSRSQRLVAAGAAIAVGLIGGLALQPVWEGISRFGEFGSTSVSEILVWAGVTLAALAAYRAVMWLQLRSSTEDSKLSVRRKGAEDALFAAYRERDRIRSIRWLHAELRGGAGKPAFFRELRQQIESVEAAVNRLDDLYQGLHDEAAAEVAQAEKDPAHVLATVGDCLAGDQGVAAQIVPEVALRLHVDAALDPNHRMRSLDVRIQPLDTDEGNVPAAAVAVATLYATLNPDEQALPLGEGQTASRWKGAVWKLVNWKLGQDLPRTFEDALIKCEGDAESGTRFLTGKLNAIDFPRRPSVDLRVPATEPIHRQMYTGSQGISAQLNAALGDPALDPAKAARLREYVLNAQVVQSLGEQVVFLDLWADDKGQPWAPNVISNADEAAVALRTYYGADAAAPEEATARTTCFTVIPELLAATKIEFGGTVQPLEPSVTARLLGSDLDMQGPTYAELFYLLRAHGHIRFDREGAGPTARTVVRLSLDEREPIGLVDLPAGGIADANYFGSGRASVVAFDAFCEFMRFEGTPLIAGAVERDLYPKAALLKSGWANDARRVASLQHAAALLWYKGDIDSDCEAMIRVLEDDLEQMENGNGQVRDSWERAMRRLLDGDERRRIRRTHLSG